MSPSPPNARPPHHPVTPSLRHSVIFAALTLLALAAIYLWLLRPQLGRPLVYDDVNFASAARAVAETGLPYGNQGHMSDRWDFSRREQWALWHPPLYVELLGLQFKLFGVSETSGRLLGAAFGLLTAALVYLTGRALGPGGSLAREATGLLGAAFYLLSPLAIQSALILDIDGTVLTFLLALLAYVLVRFPPERHPRSLPALAALFALALWAKLTTPLGLLACLVVVRVLAGRPRQALRELLIVGLGGGAIFLVTWGLACLVFRMPFDMPFAVTWIELLDASENSRSWLRSPTTVAQTVAPSLLWTGPYLAPLFAAAGLASLRGYLTTRKVQPIDLLLGFGVVIFFIYLIKLAGGFPKYHVAMLPFWAVSVGALVVETVGRLLLVEGVLLLGGLALFGWYFATRLPEAWVYGYNPDLGNQLAVFPGLLAAGLLAAFYLATGRGLGRGLALVLTVMALAWGPAVERSLGRVGYSTTYYFGTHGQREAAEVVDALTAPDEFYAASKDVAWYARNQRYLDQDTLEFFVRQAGNRFDGRLLGYDVRVLALWVRPDFLQALYREALSPAYDLVAERGDYAIWVRKAQ
jgi:4-amino-4-deoxy-L-arabinose transferase-like glycosyltransferase